MPYYVEGVPLYFLSSSLQEALNIAYTRNMAAEAFFSRLTLTNVSTSKQTNTRGILRSKGIRIT